MYGFAKPIKILFTLSQSTIYFIYHYPPSQVHTRKLHISLFVHLFSIFSLQHKTGFEANYCKAFSNKRKRPEIMDRQDDQPVRLASPSVNVLDYRSVNLYELNH